jgi:hypothetical protein
MNAPVSFLTGSLCIFCRPTSSPTWLIFRSQPQYHLFTEAFHDLPSRAASSHCFHAISCLCLSIYTPYLWFLGLYLITCFLCVCLSHQTKSCQDKKPVCCVCSCCYRPVPGTKSSKYGLFIT